MLSVNRESPAPSLDSKTNLNLLVSDFNRHIGSQGLHHMFPSLLASPVVSGYTQSEMSFLTSKLLFPSHVHTHPAAIYRDAGVWPKPCVSASVVVLSGHVQVIPKYSIPARATQPRWMDDARNRISDVLTSRAPFAIQADHWPQESDLSPLTCIAGYWPCRSGRNSVILGGGSLLS